MARAASKPKEPTDAEIRLLLARHKCPVPFHAVRTRFLGNIASPALNVSPIEVVKSLWGGELPEFESTDAVNELMAVLVMGLWNGLARHQERKAPFRLLRFAIPTDREALGNLALVRGQELVGFIEGVFGSRNEMDLPERAHKALKDLGEVRELFLGVHRVCSDPTKFASKSDVVKTVHQVATLSKIAEHEIHEAVLSCTRARRDMLSGMATTKPTLH
jgi:hypothetical protein